MSVVLLSFSLHHSMVCSDQFQQDQETYPFSSLYPDSLTYLLTNYTKRITAHPASSVAVMTALFPGAGFHFFAVTSRTVVDNADSYRFAAAVDSLLKRHV